MATSSGQSTLPSHSAWEGSQRCIDTDTRHLMATSSVQAPGGTQLYNLRDCGSSSLVYSGLLLIARIVRIAMEGASACAQTKTHAVEWATSAMINLQACVASIIVLPFESAFVVSPFVDVAMSL